MNADLSAGGCGIERIEQQVGNDLSDFAAKARHQSLCLNAPVHNHFLLVGLVLVEIHDLVEQFPQPEVGGPFVVAVELQHLGSNATESSWMHRLERIIATGHSTEKCQGR
jgi:hypothetical protein